jgi:hypothetical protein
MGTILAVPTMARELNSSLLAQTFYGNASGCLICGGTVTPTMLERDMNEHHDAILSSKVVEK